MGVKIYTRTGDRGTTSIHRRVRVSKTDIRIEANGTLDELNVAIGIARSFMAEDSPWQPLLKEIQMTMMTVMSRVATPGHLLDANPNALPADMVGMVEEAIDNLCVQCGKAEYFVLPGGNRSSAFLQQARVVARRAERLLWRLNENDSVEAEILQWVNRLSDLFFMLARYELVNAGLSPEQWQSFAYKRNKK